jgi:hypothetical protein
MDEVEVIGQEGYSHVVSVVVRIEFMTLPPNQGECLNRYEAMLSRY